MSEKALFCTGAGGFIGRYILSHYLEQRITHVIQLAAPRDISVRVNADGTRHLLDVVRLANLGFPSSQVPQEHPS